MILYALIYFLNGISLAFFITAGMRMFFYARRTGSRPHLLFAICLGWMALIQVKEFFCNFIPFYNYEVLGPAFTFPDLLTLPLLSSPDASTCATPCGCSRRSHCSAAPTSSGSSSSTGRSTCRSAR